MLAKDDRKRYFMRALAALTDENKHSPERFISKLPVGKFPVLRHSQLYLHIHNQAYGSLCETKQLSIRVL